jgi:hypothetical protein
MKHFARKRYFLVLFTLIALAGFLLHYGAIKPVLASPPGLPSLNASPGTPQTGGAAPVGATVTVTGSGFGSAETVTVSLNGQTLATTPNPLITRTDGSFTTTFIVPSLPIRS